MRIVELYNTYIHRIYTIYIYVHSVYIFRQMTMFIEVRMAIVFELQTLRLIDFTKIYQLKCLKPKYKGNTNFHECCDLTKKVYLENSHKQNYLDFFFQPRLLSFS